MKDWVIGTIIVLLAAQGKCMTLPAQVAGSHARFRLGQQKEDLFIAGIVMQNNQDDTNYPDF